MSPYLKQKGVLIKVNSNKIDLSSSIINNGSKIKKENLNKYHYTLSLLQKARRNNLLDEGMIKSIQQEIFILLKELIQKYTKGKSSSVKVETAEFLQSSILYSIDIKLSSVSSPEDSLNIIQEKNMKEIYEQGINIVESLFDETKKLYDQIKENRLKIPLEVYNSSIDQALPDFFSNYNIKYNASNTVTMIDYPLIFDDMKVQGVLYIKNYLETLKLETTFCNYFNIKDIRDLLKKYGQIYKVDYREIPINLFELVLNNSIFSTILDDNILNLEISISKYRILHDLLTEISAEKIKSLVNRAVGKINKELSIQDHKLINYIKQYIPLFMGRLLNSIENDCLYNITLTDIQTEEKDKIVFSSRNSMNDNIFRSIVEKISNCAKTDNKIKIINTKIKSMDDFLDILSADCLYNDEFFALFQNISDMELAVLAKIIFTEEIRVDEFDLSSLESKNIEEEWQLYYIKFIKKLNKNHQKQIIKLINKIEF